MTMQRNARGQFIQNPNGEKFEGFGVFSDSKGYRCIWIDGKSIKLHVLLWERINGTKPPGFVLHHRDFDKANYAVSNLELLSESAHRRIHAGWVRNEQGEWAAKPCNACGEVFPLDRFYPRKGYTPSALCRTCHNAAILRRRRREVSNA